MSKIIDDNTEIGRIIKLARGSRSLRQYAEDAGVNFTTVSKIENGEYKPSPKMIRKLTSPEAKPQNGITYEDVMSAAGFKTANDKDEVSEAAHEMAEQIVDEKFSENLAKEEGVKNKAIERDADFFIEMEQMSFKERKARREMLINIAKGLIYNAISQRGLVFTNLQDNERPWRRDYELMLAIDKGKTRIWRIDFSSIYSISSRYRGAIMEDMLLGRTLRYMVDDSMKFSFVTNNLYLFSHLESREHKLPYRGDLSVILVDLEKMTIEKEIYLSNYYEKDYSSEFFLV